MSAATRPKRADIPRAGGPQYVYAVWAMSCDFYNYGQWISIHATEDGATKEALRILHTDLPGIGKIYKTHVDTVELQP